MVTVNRRWRGSNTHDCRLLNAGGEIDKFAGARSSIPAPATKTHPLRAIGWRGRLGRTDIGNIQDHFSVIYEYPGGIMFSHAANQFSKGLFGRVTEEFICTNGTIETSRRKVTVYDANEVSWTMEAKVEISVDMLDQFIARIRSGKVENAGLSAAESTLTGILPAPPSTGAAR